MRADPQFMVDIDTDIVLKFTEHVTGLEFCAWFSIFAYKVFMLGLNELMLPEAFWVSFLRSTCSAAVFM